MSFSGRLGLLIAGLAFGAYTLLWVIDPRGWTSTAIRLLYGRAGGWLWPGGSERSYVHFHRFVTGGLGLAWSAVAIGFAIADFVRYS